ncbi:MAG: heme biosynthesis HemY N-terminal domain-containing protein [Thiogranum sp.]|nr:heme biosynthesis HemY N-terminal domain-containing protein [Thiogranum sp.]
MGILALVTSVTVALVTLPDPGYVLIGYGNTSMETSLLVFVVLLVIAYLMVRFVAGVVHLPGHVHRRGRQRKQKRFQNLYNQAVIELTDGRFEKAERHLFRLTSFADAPLNVFLSAARAANRLNADTRRDTSLRRAMQHYPDAETSVALVAAELQLARGQLDQARTTLNALQAAAPHNPQVLRLLAQLLLQLAAWNELEDLLPELKQRNVLDAEQWQQLAVKVYRRRLHQDADAHDIQTLTNDWRRLPSSVQVEAELVAVYTGQLVRLNASAQAERVLAQQIRKNWDPRLVYLYGDVVAEDRKAQQNVAEHWLDSHPEDPVLLLTLGKISLRNELWGKAQHYFEESIGRHPTSEAYRLLGSLLDQLDEPERAAECYRKGIDLRDQRGFAELDSSARTNEPGEQLIPISRIA